MYDKVDRSAVRAHHKRHRSYSQIAEQLGMNRKTVKAILEGPVDKEYKRKSVAKADAFKDSILGWHQKGVTIKRMCELARETGHADREPYQGSRTAFYARAKLFIDAYEQERKERFVRFEGLAGEYCQVDWGEVRNFPFSGTPGETRYFLAMRLKFSRLSYAVFTRDMTLETLIRCMLEGFAAFGGVSWVGVFDNMKTVTLGRDAENRPIWNPTFLRFAFDLDFHPEACSFAAGNQKGAVENLVKWVKGNFLNGREFVDDADLARQCRMWLEQANTAVSQAHGEVPREVWAAEERSKLTALQTSAADYGLFHTVKSSADSFAHIDGNRYSIPVGYAELPLTARVRRDAIDFYDADKHVAHWVRAHTRHKKPFINPDHFEPVFKKKPRARIMVYRDHLVALDGSVAGYITELCRRRRREGFGPEILELYRLWKVYGTEELGVACALASEHGAYGAEYLLALLQHPEASPRLEALAVVGAPAQHEVDRSLAEYEAFAEGRSGDGQ